MDGRHRGVRGGHEEWQAMGVGLPGGRESLGWVEGQAATAVRVGESGGHAGGGEDGLAG